MSQQTKFPGVRNAVNNLPARNQSYPQEPIGTRPSYVGEVISLIRDGTEEIKHLLEFECDLRYNCKVCGSVLPTVRAFVIHKRQFCTSKYVEYQRKNVAIMERISNVVSFHNKSLQTESFEDSLELLNPINASLLIPLPVQENGYTFANSGQNGHLNDVDEDGSDVGSEPAEIPEGVEIIQPARAPADGVYRFGMGGLNLLASKKKKHRNNSSTCITKKKKPAKVDSRRAFPPTHVAAAAAAEEGPSQQTKEISILKNIGLALQADESMEETSQESDGIPLPKAEVSNVFPSIPIKPAGSITTRSKRGTMAVRSDEVFPVNGTTSRRVDSVLDNPQFDTADLRNDLRDPQFIRKLLEQLGDVADYVNKRCKECNRNVVSVYNLDRHVATQHLGLRESEYSCISKELRQLRTEVFGPFKTDELQTAEEPSSQGGLKVEEDVSIEQSCSAEENAYFPSDPEYPSASSSRQGSEDHSSTRHENDSQGVGNVDGSELASTSRDSPHSELITERLTAIIRNPNTLKEILSTKDKDVPHVDYSLEDLSEIQRKILDAVDPYLQCCRLCNKQYFDVYVLNRHVMTVHLRLPERSCGSINKQIKEHMKRFPHAFSSVPGRRLSS